MEATPTTFIHKLAAEALGTFFVIATAAGAALFGAASEFGGSSIGINVQVAGFATVAAMYALGRWSGGHFNPAVTVGSALSGRTAWSDALAYIGAQVAGAVAAAIVLVILAFGIDGFSLWDDPLGGNALGDDGTGYALWAGLIATLIATALVVLAYLGLTDERNEQVAFAPLGMGLAVFAGLAATSLATGGSVSLAQSFGLGLVSGGTFLWQGVLIGIMTLIGGAAGGFAYYALFGADRDAVPGSGLDFGSKPAANNAFAPASYQQQWGQPAQGGYAPPAAQQPGGYAPPAAAEAAPQPVAEQPIIQDGWQWDPQAQQWIPAQQQAPQAPQGWAPGAPAAGEQTQIRPTDGS